MPATTPYRFSYIEGEHALEEYAALLRLAFPGEGVDILGKRLYDAHPGMSPRNFFSLWDGDRMVATLNLIPMIWSLEGVPLSVAEMGLVATHPEYRQGAPEASQHGVRQTPGGGRVRLRRSRGYPTSTGSLGTSTR